MAGPNSYSKLYHDSYRVRRIVRIHVLIIILGVLYSFYDWQCSILYFMIFAILWTGYKLVHAY